MVDFLLGGRGARAGAYPHRVPPNQLSSRRYQGLRSAFLAVAGALAGTLAALVLAVERLEITGQSMQPALEPGDRVLVLRFTLGLRRGDVVALPDPRDTRRIVVKRVDLVDNGEIRVLGDNSMLSTDSRHFGPVSRRSISGRVFYRYAPEPRRGLIRTGP